MPEAQRLIQNRFWGKNRREKNQQERCLKVCQSGAVRGAEQDFSLFLTAWSVQPDRQPCQRFPVPTSLQGETLTDGAAEGHPASELSWVGESIFLFAS